MNQSAIRPPLISKLINSSSNQLMNQWSNETGYEQSLNPDNSPQTVYFQSETHRTRGRGISTMTHVPQDEMGVREQHLALHLSRQLKSGAVHVYNTESVTNNSHPLPVTFCLHSPGHILAHLPVHVHPSSAHLLQHIHLVSLKRREGRKGRQHSSVYTSKQTQVTIRPR